MYLSAKNVSTQAKIDIQGYRWTAIVAVVVPLILAAIVDFILSLVFTNEIFGIIISFTTSTIAAYMTTKMVLELIKGSYSAGFSKSLKPFNILVAFIGISIVFFGIQQLIGLILSEFFLGASNFDALLDDIDNLSSAQLISLLGKSIPLILVSLILTTIIETKFFSAKYLVVEGSGIIKAFITSWNYTKGYFFSIIKVHLLFLVYIIAALAILFIGVFVTSFIPFLSILVLIAFMIWALCFFLPHYTYALAHLHLILRAANGKPVQSKRATLDTQVNSASSETDEFNDTPEEIEEEKTDSWDF